MPETTLNSVTCTNGPFHWTPDSPRLPFACDCEYKAWMLAVDSRHNDDPLSEAAYNLHHRKLRQALKRGQRQGAGAVYTLAEEVVAGYMTGIEVEQPHDDTALAARAVRTLEVVLAFGYSTTLGRWHFSKAYVQKLRDAAAGSPVRDWTERELMPRILHQRPPRCPVEASDLARKSGLC